MDVHISVDDDQSSSNDLIDVLEPTLIEDRKRKQFTFKPYKYFLMMYCFNALFILPFFITKTLVQLIQMTFLTLRQKSISKASKVILYYIIDISMAVSVLSMYPLSFMASESQFINFQFWAISNLIFLQSFILLQSYMIIMNQEEWSYELLAQIIISEKNMNQLGLGRLAKRLRTNVNDQNSVKRFLKKEFDSWIQNVLEQENIDDTLFYFAMDDDVGRLKVEDMEELNNEKLAKLLEILKIYLEQDRNDNILKTGWYSQRGTLRVLHTQGFRGNRHILDNLLWPHFHKLKTIEHIKPTSLVLIVVFVLLLKLSYPTYQLILHDEAKKSFMILLMFAGMLLNMFSILIDLVINDDLRGRRYLLGLHEALILQRMDEEDESFDILPRNFNSKIDLSCNLSLESWDNARRLSLFFDVEHCQTLETTFSFLTLYWIYTYVVMSQDFLGFAIFPALHHFFSAPIQEWSILIDFILITLLVLTRVYQGTLYNRCFKVYKFFMPQRIRKQILYLSAIYEDKKSLFEYYYCSSIFYQIENENYKNIFHRILLTATEKTLFYLVKINADPNHVNIEQIQELIIKRAKVKLNELCYTTHKLQGQVNFDYHHFHHRFLGVFKSNIHRVFSTFLVLIYIFCHAKIKHYFKDQEMERYCEERMSHINF